MKKFVILDSHELEGADFNVDKKILEDAGIECVIAKCKNTEEIIEVAGDADGIGLVYSKIDENVLKELPKCKVIVRYGVGYDSVDLAAAGKRNVLVCNIPDYCQPEVATHALAMILDMNRKVTYFDRKCRQGEWNSNLGYEMNRLSNLTIGLVGFGNISRTLAKYLKGFEPRIIAYDPYAQEEKFQEAGVEKVTIDELFKEADVISIHTPLTEDTKHLINSESLAKMKDGVYIVNTSRGPVVNTKDLMEALKSGKVKAAALDVLEEEPIFDKNFELYSFDQVIVNPHSAYNSAEAEYEQHKKVAETAIKVLLHDEVPYNTANKRFLSK